METKEQLCREYTEWSEKYEKAHEKVSAVLRRWYKIQGGGTISEWNELFTDAEIALKDEERAIAKLREINHKLRELSQ